jgi:hypothetical protein
MSDFGESFERELRDEPPLISSDRVMSAWRTIIDGEAPWGSMPADDRDGELRHVIDELLDVADGLECTMRRRRIRHAARVHGEFRGAQRCPELVVFSDFVVLRSATRFALRARGVPRSCTRDFVRALLPDWQFARRMALAAHREVRGTGDSSD